MTSPRAVAVYARISSDPSGTALGVARQVKDCRARAEALGWPVVDEYIDNDVSAFRGARRPEYERMLADLGSGRVDGVIVWHIDRLTRRPIELEQFVHVIDAAKVSAVHFVTGDADLGSGDGLLMARIMAAVASKESADKSRRVTRKMQERAEQGLPHGAGGRRPYGYTADGLEIVPDEAAVITDLVRRLLAGESTLSLTRWLNDQGIPSSTGGQWRTGTLRTILTSARLAGLRAYKGETFPAVWPPIISMEDHHRITALYATKKNSGRRTPQRYLLSGLLRCGRCGNRLYSSARREGTSMGPRNGKPRLTARATRRYVCSSSPDHGGCGRLTIVAEPVERLLVDAVLYRLDTPELAAVLAGKNSDDAVAQELSRTIENTGTQLAELADAYAARQITMSEWLRARRTIEAEQDTARRRLAARTRNDALIGLPGNGADLRTAWDSMNLSRQVAIVSAIIDHAIIQPGQRGATTVDAERVQVTWRV